ncbi:hypothetical protein D3C73_955180 [compost metagenome]
MPGEALLQPAVCRWGVGVLIPQLLDQLGGKQLGEGAARPGGDVFVECRDGATLHEQPGAEGIGIGSDLLGQGDLLHQAAQVFNEHDPEGDGHGPQLPYGQGLHALIGEDEAAQDFGVEVAVVVGDEGPGDAKDPGVAREGAGGELGQLTVVTAGQAAADLVELGLDQVIVVEEPLGRVGQIMTQLELGGAAPVGAREDCLVGLEPQMQGGHRDGGRRHRLRLGQGSGMEFQPLYAEQLFTNGLLALPGAGGAMHAKPSG